jgi:uroporphyrinogen-III synthase
MPPAVLDGLTLVVTRPAQQGEATAQWLETHGARALRFPVLAIEARTPALAAETLAHADAFIFVSANAAEFGLPHLPALRDGSSAAKVYAIGRATGSALHRAGVQQIVAPEGDGDSEALLARPELAAVSGQTIVLVRGESESGGRALLAQTLAARGAKVFPFDCYWRRPVQASEASRRDMRDHLARNDVHAFFALSVETLDSLIANLPTLAHARVAMLVPHRRVAEAARSREFPIVHIVPAGGDELIARLSELKSELMANS